MSENGWQKEPRQRRGRTTKTRIYQLQVTVDKPSSGVPLAGHPNCKRDQDNQRLVTIRSYLGIQMTCPVYSGRAGLRTSTNLDIRVMGPLEALPGENRKLSISSYTRESCWLSSWLRVFLYYAIDRSRPLLISIFFSPVRWSFVGHLLGFQWLFVGFPVVILTNGKAA